MDAIDVPVRPVLTEDTREQLRAIVREELVQVYADVAETFRRLSSV